jgi:hypothetical protein
MTPLFRRRPTNLDPRRRFYDRPIPWASRAPFVLLLPLAGFALWWSGHHPAFADAWAATGYPLVSHAYGWSTGWIPFSVAEWLLVLGALWWLALAARAIRRVRVGSRRARDVVAHAVVNGLATAGLLLALFAVWGLNYQRTPLRSTAGYAKEPKTAVALRELCEALVERTNVARTEVRSDEETGLMSVDDTPRAALDRAWLGFHRAEQLHPKLFRGRTGAVKSLTVLSVPVDILGWSGLFVPLTGEPTVNPRLPDVVLPFAACHQLAHQAGWAREADASFAGWLACSTHPDADFRYSALLSGLDESMAALYAVDPRGWTALVERLTPSVRDDWRTLRESGTDSPCPRITERTAILADPDREAPRTDRWVDLLVDEFGRSGAPSVARR